MFEATVCRKKLCTSTYVVQEAPEAANAFPMLRTLRVRLRHPYDRTKGAAITADMLLAAAGGEPAPPAQTDTQAASAAPPPSAALPVHVVLHGLPHSQVFAQHAHTWQLAQQVLLAAVVPTLECLELQIEPLHSGVLDCNMLVVLGA